MTNQQHPITPPPELVQQWREELVHDPTKPFAQAMADRAAQWGADHELEACCEWLDREGWSGESRQLRVARRPKPLSLKEQALDVLERFNSGEMVAADKMYNTIRRALEQLDD